MGRKSEDPSRKQIEKEMEDSLSFIDSLVESGQAEVVEDPDHPGVFILRFGDKEED